MVDARLAHGRVANGTEGEADTLPTAHVDATLTAGPSAAVAASLEVA